MDYLQLDVVLALIILLTTTTTITLPSLPNQNLNQADAAEKCRQKQK